MAAFRHGPGGLPEYLTVSWAQRMETCPPRSGGSARQRAANRITYPERVAAMAADKGEAGDSKKSPAQKAPARKAAEKAPARPVGTARPASADDAPAANTTGAPKVAAKKTMAQPAATSGSPAPAAGTAAAPGALAVLPGEDAWTPQEVEEARAELTSEVERLKSELLSSEAAVEGLMRDAGGSTGDEADTGSKNITREYELALAGQTRDTLTQAEHALQRLDEGTYGLCEVCGNPIGKARMQAFPRATLCLDDKQRQERR
jgi:RNA polymerase-binding protein DksA